MRISELTVLSFSYRLNWLYAILQGAVSSKLTVIRVEVQVLPHTLIDIITVHLSIHAQIQKILSGFF